MFCIVAQMEFSSKRVNMAPPSRSPASKTRRSPTPTRSRRGRFDAEARMSRSRSSSRSSSRSQSRSRSRSPSRSASRSRSKSPSRSYSRSQSRSPSRSYSRRPSRRYSRSPSRRYSRGPSRSYSKSLSRSHSRSPSRSRSGSSCKSRGARSPSPTGPFVDYNGRSASVCVDDHGSYRLFVSNLDPALSRFDLESAFEMSVTTLNFSPKFAIVAVDGRERAEEAVRTTNGKTVGDRSIKVRFAWKRNGDGAQRQGLKRHYRYRPDVQYNNSKGQYIPEDQYVPEGRYNPEDRYSPGERYITEKRYNPDPEGQYSPKQRFHRVKKERGYYGSYTTKAYVDERPYVYRDRPFPPPQRGHGHLEDRVDRGHHPENRYRPRFQRGPHRYQSYHRREDHQGYQRDDHQGYQDLRGCRYSEGGRRPEFRFRPY